MVEVAERIGPTLAYWREQPFAFLLWTYRHLQELDRRREWVARVQRIEAAMLSAMGFHDPKLLDTERATVMAAAARPVEPTIPADITVLRDRLSELLTDG